MPEKITLYKNTDLYDVYIIHHNRGVNLNNSLEDRLKIFSGTLQDALPVIDMYEALWSKVVDERLGTRPVQDLTDDHILLNWESCDIVAVDQKDDSRQFFFVGGSSLQERWLANEPFTVEAL